MLQFKTNCFFDKQLAIISSDRFFALGLQNFLDKELRCKHVELFSSIKDFASSNFCQTFDIIMLNCDYVLKHEFYFYKGLFSDSRIVSFGEVGVLFFNLLLRSYSVVAFLINRDEPEELVKAFKAIYSKRNFFSKLFNEYLTSNSKNYSILNKISVRESEVLNLLCQGYDTDAIASLLSISPRTVVRHKANLMQKTRTLSTLHLVTSFLNSSFSKEREYLI